MKFWDYDTEDYERYSDPPISGRAAAWLLAFVLCVVFVWGVVQLLNMGGR